MNKLKRTMLKERLEYWIATEQMPKGDALEQVFYELADDDNIAQTIQQYRQQKEKLVNEYNNINEQLNKLVDQYYNELIKNL